MTSIAFIKQIQGVEVVFFKDEDPKHHYLRTQFMIRDVIYKLEAQYPNTPSGLKERDSLFESRKNGVRLEHLDKIIPNLERAAG